MIILFWRKLKLHNSLLGLLYGIVYSFKAKTFIIFHKVEFVLH